MKLFTERTVRGAGFLVFFVLSFFPCEAQTPFRVMSYNVENGFDPRPSPEKNDLEFLPDGNRRWSWNRYLHKLRRIAQVITVAGEWNTPALVALCEVENDSVLVDLLTRTPLRRQNYRYRITRSSDKRGINVALLYQRDRFRLLGDRAVVIRFSGNRHKQTRDILHVWGEVLNKDTLDVFVCHFPSRYGGEKESEKDRFDAARTLRAVCDSVASVRHSPRILILGDFNDTPDDRSLTEILGARPYRPDTTSATVFSPDSAAVPHSPPVLYNLFADRRSFAFPGTHKYQGEWSQLDQMLVNAPLLDLSSSFSLIAGSVRIFSPSFLLTEDKTWLGRRPFRSYYGFKYEGGYSDHLPILADFRLSSRQ